MYYLRKELEVSASHKLALDYDSPCCKAHGHNWKIIVCCRNETLDSNGMVVDFKVIKKKVHDVLDHQNLNEVLDFNPTAENMAKWIVDSVPHCYKAVVQETEGNEAVYEV